MGKLNPSLEAIKIALELNELQAKYDDVNKKNIRLIQEWHCRERDHINEMAKLKEHAEAMDSACSRVVNFSQYSGDGCHRVQESALMAAKDSCNNYRKDFPSALEQGDNDVPKGGGE